MKEYAKSLVQAGLPVRREGAQRKVVPETTSPPQVAPLPPHSVYRQQDSWAARNRRESFTSNNEVQPAVAAPPPPPPVETVPTTEDSAEEYKYTKYRAKREAMLKSHKVRRVTMSICVSEQEHDILSDFCQERGVSVSQYVRDAAFRSMGRPLPSRNLRGRKRKE